MLLNYTRLPAVTVLEYSSFVQHTLHDVYMLFIHNGQTTTRRNRPEMGVGLPPAVTHKAATHERDKLLA